MKFLVFLFCLICITWQPAYAEPTTITISSGEWLPYSGASKTTRYEQFIENIFYLAGYQVNWRYPGFDFALQELDRKRTDGAFPFFSTAKRGERYLVSSPVHSTRNIVLFNRFSKIRIPSSLETTDQRYRIGTVSGYSYGKFDTTLEKHERVTFNSELAALEALKEGEIDLLPIEEFVWVNLVLQNFPHDYHRFSVLEGISWDETLHLIMTKTESNRKIMSIFDRLLSELDQQHQDEVRKERHELLRTINAGTVTLEPSQLQPIIRSTLKNTNKPTTIAIQPGTRGVVLQWPDIVFDLPDDLATVQILRSKVDVLLLSGAHSGSIVTTELNHIRVGSQ